MKIHFKAFELMQLAGEMIDGQGGKLPESDIAFMKAKISESMQAISIEPLRPTDCQRAMSRMHFLSELADESKLKGLGLLFLSIQNLLTACEVLASKATQAELFKVATDHLEMPEAMREYLRALSNEMRHEAE